LGSDLTDSHVFANAASFTIDTDAEPHDFLNGDPG
jgi:hypothetical protein